MPGSGCASAGSLRLDGILPIVSKSLPSARDAELSTFSLFVRKELGIYQPAAKLKDKPIAIEMGTGAYYTTVSDLERFMPRDSAKLVQVGRAAQAFPKFPHQQGGGGRRPS